MKHAMTLATAIGLALALAGLPALAQNEFGSKELIEAAEKEGQLTYYTANFAETEQEVIKEFNKRFPKVKVAMVRAPGGQLITRIKTEAAAGKLGADVVNHSDRGLMLELADLFQDYPEYKGKQIGQVVGPSGGTTWTRVMFERQVLGEDYWQKQAALGIALFPSGAPTSDSLVRGEISIAPLLYNIIYTKIVEGAPAEAIFAPEGVPIIPYADGIPKTAKSPNAAKLFMNWRLSKEGQAFQIAKLGNITSLKEPPSFPKGWDPKVIKVWVPNFKEFESLRESWLEQWNKTYGYRQ